MSVMPWACSKCGLHWHICTAMDGRLIRCPSCAMFSRVDNSKLFSDTVILAEDDEVEDDEVESDEVESDESIAQDNPDHRRNQIPE